MKALTNKQRQEMGARHNEGIALMDKGDAGGALECFKAAEEASSGTPYSGAPALFYCLLALGRMDDAKNVFDQHIDARIGTHDGANCEFLLALTFSGFSRAAPSAGLALLRQEANYTDDRTRGELCLLTVVLGALSVPDRLNLFLRDVGTAVGNKLGGRAPILKAVIEEAFWKRGKALVDPSLAGSLMWEWNVVHVIQRGLRKPEAWRSTDAQALLSHAGAWSRPLSPVLRHVGLLRR